MTERTEERLRAALRAEEHDVDVERAWDDVQRKVAGHRRWLPGRAILAAAAAIVVLGALGGSLLLLDDDDRVRVDVGPVDEPTTTTTEPESTTTTTSTTTSVPASETEPLVGPTGSIWPYWSFEQIDGQPETYRDPTATALGFARDYLGMPDPVAPDGFREAEGQSGWVHVLPRAGAPMRTQVWLHRYGGADGPYAVYHADTDNIRPDTDTLTEPVGRTIAFRGTSTAYEGNITVEVREDGGRLLGTTFVTGGANGEFGPFSGEITIDEPTTVGGAITFATESAEDGTRQEAAVVRITFDNMVSG